jgi:long-chain acyl-CoA synthetase
MVCCTASVARLCQAISYQQLDYSTTSLARWLLAEGCKAGDRIALHWPNSIEIATLLLACFKARLIAVPVNVSMKAPETAYVLSHSQAKMCFVHPDRLPVAKEAAKGCKSLWAIHSSLKEADDREEPLTLPLVREDDTALILYTSGTTARPKGAAHTAEGRYRKSATPVAEGECRGRCPVTPLAGL